MPLPVFEKKDDIPAPFLDEYEERDGKWHPKKQPAPDLESALEKERTRASTEETARKKAERELADEKRRKEAEKSGITDEQLQKLRDEDAKARKPIEDENTVLKAENRKLKLTDNIEKEALAAGVFPEDLKTVMRELMYPGEERFDLTKEGSPVVLDATTRQATTKTLKDFFTDEYKKLRPKFYQGSGASGSGAGGSGGGGGGGGSSATASEDQLAAKRQQVAGAL